MSVAAPDHLFRAGPRRALPRTCRPAPDETTGSYLLRLAAANRVTGPDLIGYLTAGTSQSIAKISLTALVTASGQPPLILAYALPELRPQYPDVERMALRGRTLPARPNMVRPACRRCAAARTAERIDMWCRHEHNVCLRHLLWIGRGAGDPRDQVDLAAHSDIVHAQVRHRRLIREHGYGIVHTAYHTAREIWETLIYRGWGVPCALARDMRLPAWFGHQDWAGDPRDPVHQAATYPEVITLTGLLASPHWRPFAMSASAADHDRFRAEFQRRLPPDYRDLANASLQLRAAVGGASVTRWYRPAVEVVHQRGCPASGEMTAADLRRRMKDQFIYTSDDVLRMLDALLAGIGTAWWDQFFADQSRPCPFFTDRPDENLAAWFGEGQLTAGRVLELGCGHGRNAAYLAGLGCDVLAVDFSAEAIERARKRARPVSGSADFRCCSIFDADFAEESYDLVYDSGCFHDVAPHRRKDYVDLVRKALKPGGSYGLVCFRPEGGSGYTDLQVYQRASLGGGLGYSADRLRALWDKPPFSLRGLRQMNKASGQEPYFGEDYLWVLLATKEGAA